MGLMKNLVAAGAHHLRGGGKGYEPWCQLMVSEFGAPVLPILPFIRKWSYILAYAPTRFEDFKINCWEFAGCGKEHPSFQCPAYSEQRLHGIHGGRNAGRACWSVPGTMCGDEVQGAGREKQPTCGQCDFYLCVRDEEADALLALHILEERLG